MAVNRSAGSIVLVPRDKDVSFPPVCLRCLGPADKTLKVRSTQEGWFALRWTTFQVPTCKACHDRFAPKIILFSLLGWGLAGLAIVFLVTLTGSTRWIAVLSTAFASMVARYIYNPFGVRVFRGGTPRLPQWMWTVPTEEYARLFAEANHVKL